MAQRRRDLTTTSFPTVYNLTFSLSHFCPIFLSSPGWSPRQTPPYRVPPAKQLSTRPFILSTHFPRRLLSATHVCFAAYSLLARDPLYVLLVLCFLWRKALSLVGPCIPTSFPPSSVFDSSSAPQHLSGQRPTNSKWRKPLSVSFVFHICNYETVKKKVSAANDFSTCLQKETKIN